MKTEEEYPKIHNGWLIAPSGAKFGNSPVIQIANIVSINYYQVQSTTPNPEPSEEWDIVFGTDLKWHFENKEEMWKCYFRIISLMAGDTFEDKEYI